MRKMFFFTSEVVLDAALQAIVLYAQVFQMTSYSVLICLLNSGSDRPLIQVLAGE